MGKKKVEIERSKSNLINFILAQVTLFSFIAVIWTRVISFHYNGLQAGLAVPIDGDYLIWANTMHVFFGLMVVSSIILIFRQNLQYFPIIGKVRKASLDERQKAVRNRVFERSYFLIVLAVVLTVVFVADWNNFILIKEGDLFTNGDRRYPLQAAFILLVTLPSIIAAGQKDS